MMILINVIYIILGNILLHLFGIYFIGRNFFMYGIYRFSLKIIAIKH